MFEDSGPKVQTRYSFFHARDLSYGAEEVQELDPSKSGLPSLSVAIMDASRALSQPASSIQGLGVQKQMAQTPSCDDQPVSALNIMGAPNPKRLGGP